MALLLDGFAHHVVDTGEVEIGYSVGSGNGPAMLLLHGNSSRRDSFLNVAGLLSESYKVFAMDTRGHGFSSHTPGQYTTPNMVRDVVFVLRNVIKEPAIVWGHSMGGGIAAAALSENPELGLALVLEDSGVRSFGTRHPASPPLGQRKSGTLSIFAQQLKAMDAGLSLEEMTTKIEEMQPGQPGYYAAWKAEVLIQLDNELLRMAVEATEVGGRDPREILDKIEVPVLFMQADPDAGGLNTDEYLAEIIPDRDNFTVTKIVGAGHNINRAHTDLMLPVVLPWLAGL